MEVVRVEIKYAVPENLAGWTLQWAGVFLRRDQGLTGPQKLTTLYLDTPTLAFYRWHSEERPERFKLRVRGYSHGPQDRVWAEIKTKKGIVIRKDRAAVSTNRLDALLHGETPASELQEFVRRRRAFDASPKLLVACERDALREKSAAGEIGVTVDRHIRYQPTRRNDLIDDPHLWRPVQLPQLLPLLTLDKPPQAIVELKYMQTAPSWM